MYEVQSKQGISELNEGWIATPEAYVDLPAAMEAMAYQAEANSHLMHRVVLKTEVTVVYMLELDEIFNSTNTAKK